MGQVEVTPQLVQTQRKRERKEYVQEGAARNRGMNSLFTNPADGTTISSSSSMERDAQNYSHTACPVVASSKSMGIIFVVGIGGGGCIDPVSLLYSARGPGMLSMPTFGVPGLEFGTAPCDDVAVTVEMICWLCG